MRRSTIKEGLESGEVFSLTESTTIVDDSQRFHRRLVWTFRNAGVGRKSKATTWGG
ncbi:hypothetical protein CCACVL1_02157 [Corchorus capsularis]|uniref:Uncharacterized protein n=1 Tax=Corchorus capsularis TaxID=210143 RepID=A0A1R3KBW4_COCAP|nr:hypothetical protein CCACVL1_02157 [Corchorus capsularis]